jgi:hypothetical protein
MSFVDIPIDRDSITFERWLSNHPPDHEARWHRELYPWAVFRAVDFLGASRQVDQVIELDGQVFHVTVEKAFLGPNSRPNFVVRVTAGTPSKRQLWQHLQWDHVFQLVTSREGKFITIFTKKTDPSKIILRNFIAGRFDSIEQTRSLPVSGFLFRSLVATVAMDVFGQLDAGAIGTVPSPRKDNAPLPKKTGVPLRPPFRPFLCQGDGLWIVHSFSEEKAHRLAMTLESSAARLIVVYCHPTFTKHQRCRRPHVNVVSLSELIAMGSKAVRNRYLHQAVFLINHLNGNDTISSCGSANDLRNRIYLPAHEVRSIHTSEVREAQAGLGREIRFGADAAYILACANLLNATLNGKLIAYSGKLRLSKDVYSFKSRFVKRLEEIVFLNCPEVAVYITPSWELLITSFGVQFSFHNLARTDLLVAYSLSDRNVEQVWCGRRLQPIASIVLAWARALVSE